MLTLLLWVHCTPEMAPQPPIWGFYGHSLINRMAVFTLPTSIIGPYKAHIDFIAEHAVDPDKRRYATRHEAVRHYIDLDHWGEFPFESLPRKWSEVLAGSLQLQCIHVSGDTVELMDDDTEEPVRERIAFVLDHIIPVFYEEDWLFECDTVFRYFPELSCHDCKKVIASEDFTNHGILPYHLVAMQSRLTRAFAKGDLDAILRLSADFGHYIADAHVPLHTTENYNGQLTNQLGIHAFWESRIPELLAESDWSFLAGQARYIEDPSEYYWSIVFDSHRLVEDVLRIEKELQSTFPEDAKFCFEERAGILVRTQCPEYTRAYADRMEGMVERRMVDAIHAIGSAWFTAWVDAGLPVFDEYITALSEKDKLEFDELQRAFIRGEAKGRIHDDE